jgi:hypothetical protein
MWVVGQVHQRINFIGVTASYDMPAYCCIQ